MLQWKIQSVLSLSSIPNTHSMLSSWITYFPEWIEFIYFFLKVVLCIELSGHLIFRYTCSRRSSLCCNLSRREFSCGAHTAINYSATVNMEKHVWINDYMETRVYNFPSAQQCHCTPTAKPYDVVEVPPSLISLWITGGVESHLLHLSWSSETGSW